MANGLANTDQWREVALRMLPEFQSDIAEAETPMRLWTELIFHFDEAYEEPKEEDLIRRIYSYADWCLEQDAGESAADHLPTCVAVCFWEHIPTCKAAREDMPRWFSYEELLANEHFFKYELEAEEWEELKQLYGGKEGSLA